ncbi:arabinan endo-1,5-alpha-L-arabinosidase [Cohnella nanjingensis]|uniref:Arabinan endo-1,5-alpha-L-arabinosidase n=2 Tax=Cohnella nanjingensis TaxID=1387779 RepID=A0A7X0RNA1_9BACL|nr:arabinan endo-1,5-alpha-L-arabinosidase [Cohnella nanjingensis]MBB6670521.1 arabinan endo-1,5-alpha-L-arabinosidase [Cohnella nanjingensis]
MMVMLGGCSGADGKAVYPPSPPETKMYDTDNLNDESAWTTTNAHDPSIIKTDDGTYYVVSTDVKVGGEPKPGLMVRKSKDLIRWEWVGHAFDGVPDAAKAWTGGPTLWAPDVHKFGEQYKLYYASSTFGSNTSYIGLATSASMEGPWRDEGEVIKTGAGDGPNAIDPQIAIDAAGDPWFVYGSFFDGIHIAPLDLATGKLREPGFGRRIAARNPQTASGAVEGPYIVYKPAFKKYYLFVSYDSLSSDYNVRVGRADAIDGPYVDFNGRELTDTAYDPSFDVGTKILGGYKFGESEGWTAPGHNSVLQDGDDDYIVHHARPEGDPSWMYLHVRKLLWTKDGWPVVSPERYAGERVQRIPAVDIPGDWERLVQPRWIDGQAESEPLRLLKGGKIDAADGKDSWSFDGEHTLTLTWSGEDGADTVETVLLLPSWDWELNRPTLVFTGLDGTGQAVWGKKLNDPAR